MSIVRTALLFTGLSSRSIFLLRGFYRNCKKIKCVFRHKELRHPTNVQRTTLVHTSFVPADVGFRRLEVRFVFCTNQPCVPYFFLAQICTDSLRTLDGLGFSTSPSSTYVDCAKSPNQDFEEPGPQVPIGMRTSHSWCVGWIRGSFGREIRGPREYFYFRFWLRKDLYFRASLWQDFYIRAWYCDNSYFRARLWKYFYFRACF